MKTLQQFTLLLFVLIQSISFAQEDKLDLINQKFNTLLTQQNKGVAILIKKDTEINTLSLGNFNLHENHVFNIGSASKTFTAILLLQEVEKGTVKLSDNIGMYLTPLKNVDNGLTILQLLTHESGLDEVIGKNIQDAFYAKNDSVYNIDLLNQIEQNNPKMIGKYDYCNTNYLLLGRIIEKITDQSYFDLVRERIIIPLKMNNTYPYLHKGLPNLATPYHQEKDVTAYLNYKFFANIANSAGSIASTLSDMELFYTSLFETDILLKKETVQQMMASGNENYGLGIMKSNNANEKLFGHGGNNIGYAFRNAYNPKSKNLFLMFSNTMSIPFEKTLKNDLLAYLSNEKIEKFKTVNIEKFKKYTGRYLLKEANLTLEIIEENTKLYLVVEAQGVKSELTQKNETTLYDTVVGATLEIIDCNEKALTFSQNGFTTTINKISPKS
ncbi:serine hydrolase domain-containing protein [Olleya sp. Ti.3.14]|uniref:serine hydrolase domain-containing protein n=1 Tax=Olleya sp. Ti.3.14 TaxID=3121297 RepID=UPI00311F7F1C